MTPWPFRLKGWRRTPSGPPCGGTTWFWMKSWRTRWQCWRCWGLWDRSSQAQITGRCLRCWTETRECWAADFSVLGFFFLLRDRVIWECKFKDCTRGSVFWKNQWPVTFQETSHVQVKNSQNSIMAWSLWWLKIWLSVKETRKILLDSNEIKISLLILQQLWSINETTGIMNASNDDLCHSSALGSQGPRVTSNGPAPAEQTSGRVLETLCWIPLSDKF